jgi:hypothetical protein
MLEKSEDFDFWIYLIMLLEPPFPPPSPIQTIKLDAPNPPKRFRDTGIEDELVTPRTPSL